MPAQPPQSAVAINAITKVSTEDYVLAADFTRLLRAGETLTSAAIAEITAWGDLTITNIQINATPYTDDNGNSLPPATVVLFEASGGTPDTPPSLLGKVYQLRITVNLNTGKKRAGLILIYLQG